MVFLCAPSLCIRFEMMRLDGWLMRFFIGSVTAHMRAKGLEYLLANLRLPNIL